MGFKSKNQLITDMGLGYAARDLIDTLHTGVVNVQAFGAKGDGVTDDTVAIQAAITAALGTVLESGKSPNVIIPAGRYKYSGKLGTLTHGIGFEGAGARQTLFFPADGYSGPMLEIQETLLGGYPSDGDTVDLTANKSGVRLKGFSIIGDRSHSGTEDGILFSGRSDEFIINDVYLQYLSGYGLKLGAAGPFTTGFCRESAIYNLQVIMCGNSIEPAVTLQDTGAGDGSNQIDWFNTRIIYPQGVGLHLENNSTANPLRRINFFGLMVHGDTTSPPAKDMIEIVGECKSINIWGGKFNGVGASNYTMVFDQNQSGNTPTDCFVHAGISTGGNGIWVKAGNDLDFYMQESTVTTNDLKVDDATYVSNSINYFNATANGLTFDIDAASAGRVNGRWYRDAEVSLRAPSFILAASNETPGAIVTSSSGSPESSVTSGPGGLCVNRAGSTDRDSDGVYYKASGVGNTGWIPLQEIRGGTTAQRPTSQTLYQGYFDTTLGHQVWWDGTNWVNSAGTTV